MLNSLYVREHSNWQIALWKRYWPKRAHKIAINNTEQESKHELSSLEGDRIIVDNRFIHRDVGKYVFAIESFSKNFGPHAFSCDTYQRLLRWLKEKKNE